MLELVALFAIVFVLGAVPNLIPASAVVVAFALRDDVDAVPAVLAGALGITLGRVALALAVRSGFDHLLRTGSTRENIEWLHGWLEGRRRSLLVLSVAVAVPGCPTTTAFVGAGALHLRLPPVALGFLVGRIAWYAGLVVAAAHAEAGVEDLIDRGLNPLAIAAAVLLVVVPLYLLSRLEWRALVLERRIRFVPRSRGPESGAGGTGE